MASNKESWGNILLACSGSVASIKLDSLIQRFNTAVPSPHIKVILTDKSQHFATRNAYDNVKVEYFTDEARDKTLGNESETRSLHIELSKWADFMIIAPISANSLAKIANGICDNLLTCTVGAWDKKKPLLFAPAMNTRMWEHPITDIQIKTLISWGWHYIPPVAKKLACGDTGVGAMADVDTITNYCLQMLPSV